MTWWQNATIYQVYPRSFFDSNDDGTGDLDGIAQKIDYLETLGIDAIWLSPFYPSPLHDGGYDVANPRDVAAELGGLPSFDRLVSKAKEHGIRIIVDLVPNHFSKDHPWFTEALSSAPNSPARKRFHFRDGKDNGSLPPNNWISLFGGPAWTQIREPDGKPGQWYLHIFDSSQPDLNWSNIDVQDDFKKTLSFWLDRGVSGFRVDVAVGLFKDMTYADDPEPQLRVDAMRLDLYDPEHPESSDEIRKWAANSPLFDRDEVHQVYRSWQGIFKQHSTDVFAVAEAWAYPATRSMAYAKSLGQVFNFDFMIVPFKAPTLHRTISELIEQAVRNETFPTWVLSNHDVSRVVSRMGQGANGLAKARALATLAHFLPGSVYIYQGEELGLPDALIPEELRLDPIWEKSGRTQIGRDGCRAPMPWDSTKPNRGFSNSAKTWLPSPTDWQVQDAKSQLSNSNSTFNLYRNLIALRKTNPIWQNLLSQTKVQTDGDLLLVQRGQDGICLVNTGSKAKIFDLLGKDAQYKLLISSDNSKVVLTQNQIEIEPNTALILEKLSTKTSTGG